MLLWLWCRLAATAPIRLLTWESAYAMGAALKSKTKQKKCVGMDLGVPRMERKAVSILTLLHQVPLSLEAAKVRQRGQGSTVSSGGQFSKATPSGEGPQPRPSPRVSPTQRCPAQGTGGAAQSHSDCMCRGGGDPLGHSVQCPLPS